MAVPENKTRFVVIGGGIAGVSCVETLSLLGSNAQVTLISASPLIKVVTNYVQMTRVGETFDVEEQPLSHAQLNHNNVAVVQATVLSVCAKAKSLTTSDGKTISYDKLCICTGGKPKVIAANNPYIIGIRDTESVMDFQSKMKTVRRVVIVGNGGIATELVYELEGCEVIWAIKDKSIASTFVDAAAGQFFMEHLNKEKDRTPSGPSKRLKYTTTASETGTSSMSQKVMGGALGPDWATHLDMHGAQSISHNVRVEHQVEVASILSPEELQLLQDQPGLTRMDKEDDSPWPVYVQLTNGRVYGCDLVVSATGVVPFTDTVLPGNDFHLASDGGLKVNHRMETSESHVYAAGDVCTACWEHSSNWLQMRLWSQARQMGCYAAKCMVAAEKGEDISLDFCFELFVHITSFFKFKVVLLGRFNSQGLGDDFEILLRVTKGQEFVKVILHNGRLVGAILIGDTDLEETFENLILNEMNLTPFKDNLLDPEIDIEDFFD